MLGSGRYKRFRRIVDDFLRLADRLGVGYVEIAGYVEISSGIIHIHSIDMTFTGRVGIILLCGRVTATLRFVQQRAYGDRARRALGTILGFLLRFGLCAILRRGDTQLVCQTFYLRLELHNLGVIRLVQSGNEIADLFHLQPQIGAQHNQIIQTVAQHATICRKQSVTVILIKFGENPGQIAGRIVYLHVLPIRDRGDGRTGEQQIAVTQSAVHRASGERP